MPPSSLRVDTTLDRTTVRLPRRVEETRLFFTTAGISLVLLTVLYLLLSTPALIVMGWIVSLIVGLFAAPMAKVAGLRIHRSRSRKSDDAGCALVGGGLFVMIAMQMSTRLLVETFTLPLPASVFFVLLTLGLLSSVPLALRISALSGTLTLTPTTLSVGQQQWLLEDVTRIETLQEGGFHINDEPVRALFALNRSERLWLKGRIEGHIAARRKALHDAGHDLNQAAAPPAALQALRQPAE